MNKKTEIWTSVLASALVWRQQPQLGSTTGYEQSNDPLRIPSLIMKKINDSIQEGFVISSELSRGQCSGLGGLGLESDLA